MNLKQITNALVYDQGNQLRGLIDSVALDGRATTEVEHKTLGQVGVLALPGRPLQALKGKIAIGHLDDEYDALLSHPGRLHTWILEQQVDVSDAGGFSAEKSHKIVWTLKFRAMSDDGISNELGEKAGLEYAITVPALTIARRGEATPIWELDVYNDVYRVMGEDVFPQ